MKQNLRRMLLGTVLAGLPFMSVSASKEQPAGKKGRSRTPSSINWNPVGSSIDDKGFALDDHGDYVGGDVVTDDTTLAVHESGGEATFNTSVLDTNLDIYGTLYPSNDDDAESLGFPCPLKVSGDVTIQASNSDVAVNIMEDVIIQPYIDAPSTVTGATECSKSAPAHVQFKAGSGRTITVNVGVEGVPANLEFRGQTVDNSGDDDKQADMLVSFVGAGKTIFNMVGGSQVTFNGDIDTTKGVAVTADGLLDASDSNYGLPQSNAGGTKVFVCMDQADALAHKVVFQRSTYDGGSGVSALNTTVEVGPNSLITFLGNNKTGDVAAAGALAFDPSNIGAGRMVLFIRGAYDDQENAAFLNAGTESESLNPDFNKVAIKYPFNDGAVVVAGHYVETEDFSAADIRSYDLSIPAGTSAVLRVIDDVLFAASESPTPYTPETEVMDDKPTARGLLVVNNVQSHGKLMSDPYWDAYNGSSDTEAWLPMNPANAQVNCRRGFVLGVNGLVDVYHNTFLEHASGALNDVDPMAFNDYLDTPYVLKQRNPSAFIVDGLDPSQFLDGNPLDSMTLSLFALADPRQDAQPMRAAINLRGSGALYLKHVGSSRTGDMYGFDLAKANGATLADVDWTSALVVMRDAVYDGQVLSADGVHVAAKNTEGLHVFDAEGELSVNGVAATAPGRTYSYTADRYGVFNASGLLRDYIGREVDIDGDPIARPLLLSLPSGDATLYPRYNKPAFFFNNNVAFNGTVLSHSTPSHFVDGLPVASEPAIVGGERMWFGIKAWDVDAADVVFNRQSDMNRYRLPEIQLYNSTLELHESLNASGVRFVTKDLFGSAGTAGSSSSEVKFFDHGDPLDAQWTGYGRIFLCGSSLNVMADGSNNFVTESCLWNIYKHNAPGDRALGSQASVDLNLTNGNEFHPLIQVRIDDIGDESAKNAFMDKQRAHHLFLFAQPNSLVDQTDSTGELYSYADDLVVDGKDPVCNLSVGWPALKTTDDDIAGSLAPAAEGGNYPFVLPYPQFGAEPLLSDDDMLVANTEFGSSAFVPDALRAQPANLNIKGSVICFGSFDKNGKSPLVPVLDDDTSGVVYVKHGGAINALNSASGLPAQTVFATMLCQRMWNDYEYDGTQRACVVAGQVSLPSDQASFDTNYAVQPYNLTTDMFNARGNETHGYVRMSGYNASRALNDRAGIPAMLLNWYYRDTNYSVDEKNDNTGDYINNFSPKSAPVRNTVAHKALAGIAKMRAGKAATRSVASVATPQDRPLDLLYVGPGDDIKQLRVSGATLSDPFMLGVSGDGLTPLIARVREFVSQKSQTNQITDHFIGEGSHAALFVEYGGRIGLGSRSWNEHSLNAWNLLGKDNVTIMPLGNGTVDVNSNLLVTDRLALMATPDFGANEVNRVTFFSQEPREIRIPAGGELDLSSFGQAANRQEIAFGGNVRLVFEAGATLRLPDADSVDAGVILYFNDQSQLVFEGDQYTGVPFDDLTAVVPLAPIKDSRIRILGAGQIWANKDAEINVNGNVFVGVESDSATPRTNLTISLQRQGSMNIGLDNIGGGAFQVGDVVENGDRSVDFSLVVNGPNALFHIDREGFFGLGAGVINKSGVPNGSGDSAPLADANPIIVDDVVSTRPGGAPVFTPVQLVASPESVDDYVANHDALKSGVWVVKPLFNVASVTVNVAAGVFEHKNIADGNAAQASVMAIGPAASCNWFQGPQNNASVRGGGNLMLVPANVTGGIVATNIWDYAGLMSADARYGSGESYNIMASGQMLKDKGGSVSEVSPADLFTFMGYQPYAAQRAKRVVVSSSVFTDQLAYTAASLQVGSSLVRKYTAGAQVVRTDSPATVQGGGVMADAFEVGALLAAGAIQPGSYSIGR